jgi:hypothetical protein
MHLTHGALFLAVKDYSSIVERSGSGRNFVVPAGTLRFPLRLLALGTLGFRIKESEGEVLGCLATTVCETKKVILGNVRVPTSGKFRDFNIPSVPLFSLRSLISPSALLVANIAQVIVYEPLFYIDYRPVAAFK